MLQSLVGFIALLSFWLLSDTFLSFSLPSIRWHSDPFVYLATITLFSLGTMIQSVFFHSPCRPSCLFITCLQFSICCVRKVRLRRGVELQSGSFAQHFNNFFFPVDSHFILSQRRIWHISLSYHRGARLVKKNGSTITLSVLSLFPLSNYFIIIVVILLTHTPCYSYFIFNWLKFSRTVLFNL